MSAQNAPDGGADGGARIAELVRCQCCGEYRFDLEWEYCRGCGAVPLAPLNEVDLCAHLGHDPYWDEPNVCGRCEAQIDGQVPDA